MAAGRVSTQVSIRSVAGSRGLTGPRREPGYQTASCAMDQLVLAGLINHTDEHIGSIRATVGK
jgi:hypothetical protein